MAWIVQLPPSPRHPKPRWQVRYRSGNHERSAGIYQTPKAAETIRRRIERAFPLPSRSRRSTSTRPTVDSDYLPHSPLTRKSHAGRVATAKNLPVGRREVWDLLARAITSRYRDWSWSPRSPECAGASWPHYAGTTST